jgi:hypothetical protein
LGGQIPAWQRPFTDNDIILRDHFWAFHVKAGVADAI